MEYETKTKSFYLVPASIVAAGLLIALSVIYSNLETRSPSDDGGKILKNSNLEAEPPSKEAKDFLVAREKDFILGNPSASVTIVEFGDFQCPFCGRFFVDTFSRLKETYVKQGKVKFIFRDFAFLGKESVDAAAAARCAGEQGKFWDFHDYLFTHQSGENNGVFSLANLKKFAKEIGLNEVDFNVCLDSKKYEEAVKNDTTQAKNLLKVNGTPTSFVNGQELVGVQPFSQFETLIKAVLE